MQQVDGTCDGVSLHRRELTRDLYIRSDLGLELATYKCHDSIVYHLLSQCIWIDLRSLDYAYDRTVSHRLGFRGISTQAS